MFSSVLIRAVASYAGRCGVELWSHPTLMGIRPQLGKLNLKHNFKQLIRGRWRILIVNGMITFSIDQQATIGTGRGKRRPYCQVFGFLQQIVVLHLYNNNRLHLKWCRGGRAACRTTYKVVGTLNLIHVFIALARFDTNKT